jgi:hypothetical protein
MYIVDLGRPWGTVRVPRGYVVKEVLAACGADEHAGHSSCHPWWREDLPEGAIVLDGPIYVDSDWVALVAIPAAPEVGGRLYAHIAGGLAHGLFDADDPPRLAEKNDEYGWVCCVCGKVLYYDYGEGMDDFIEASDGIWCLDCWGRIIPPAPVPQGGNHERLLPEI